MNSIFLSYLLLCTKYRSKSIIYKWYNRFSEAMTPVRTKTSTPLQPLIRRYAHPSRWFVITKFTKRYPTQPTQPCRTRLCPVLMSAIIIVRLGMTRWDQYWFLQVAFKLLYFRRSYQYLPLSLWFDDWDDLFDIV